MKSSETKRDCSKQASNRRRGLKRALRNFALVHGILLFTVVIAVATNHGLWARYKDEPVETPQVDAARNIQPQKDGLDGLLDGLELTGDPEDGVDRHEIVESPAANIEAGDSPLLSAFLAMRSASERLREGDVSVVTQGDQGRAIQLLDEMIRQSEGEQNSPSQQETGSQQDSAQQQSDQQQSDQQSSDSGEPNVSGDESNGQESNGQESSEDGPASDEVTAQNEGEMSGGGKEGSPVTAGDGTASPRPLGAQGIGVWGHLPEKTRGLLRAQVPTEFLPRYSEQISEYFRVLAEMKSNE